MRKDMIHINKRMAFSILAATALTTGYSTSAMAVVDFYTQQVYGQYYPYLTSTSFYQSSPSTDVIETLNSNNQTGQSSTIDGVSNSFNITQTGGTSNWTGVTQAPGVATNYGTITDYTNGSANGIHNFLDGSGNGSTQSASIYGTNNYIELRDGGSLSSQPVFNYSNGQISYQPGPGNTMKANISGYYDNLSEATQPGNANSFNANIQGSYDDLSLYSYTGYFSGVDLTGAHLLNPGTYNDHNNLTGAINSYGGGNDEMTLVAQGSSNTINGTIDGNASTMRLVTQGVGNSLTGQIGTGTNQGYGDNMSVAANGYYNNVSATQNGNYNNMALYITPYSSYNTVKASQSGSNYMDVALNGSRDNLTIAQSTPGAQLGSPTQPYIINAIGWTGTIRQ